MSRTVYRVLSRVFAVVLILVGVGALIGGNFAHSYVTDQLSQEKITMPSGDALTTDDMKAALEKYGDQPMTTGPQAEAYANHYIYAHMMKSSDGKSYSEVSSAQGACSKDDAQKDTDECQALTGLKTTLFQGDALRGMLLNAYGWWLVGTIAIWVGIGALVVGVILGGLGWFGLKDKTAGAAGSTSAPTSAGAGA